MARGEHEKMPLPIDAALAGNADISLTGEVDKEMLDTFLEQLGKARRKDGDLVLEVTTLGGDAELARRMVMEIDRARESLKGKFYFLGKSVVYSAGVSIMSAFPVASRFLSQDTILLIHGRQLEKTVEISGPLRSSIPQIDALMRQMKLGVELEEAGFKRLIEGSKLSLQEVIKRGTHNWYLTAQEACDLGLAAACV